MRAFTVLAGVVTLAMVVSYAPQAADGAATILTSGANIEAGFGNPTGQVTINDCADVATAPPLLGFPTLPPQGTITGSMPSFPGTSSSMVPLVITVDATLPGGTYDVASYDVQDGAVVTYTGAVTIRAAGDVNIGGVVTTNGGSRDITIIAGGDIRIFANAPGDPFGVDAVGSNSPVTLEANGRVIIGDPNFASNAKPDPLDAAAEVASNSGAVTIRGRGLITNTATVEISEADIRTESVAPVLIQASGPIECRDSNIRSNFGELTVQAFGGFVDMFDSGVEATVGNVLIEASTIMRFFACDLLAQAADMRLEAFGQGLSFQQGTTVEATDGLSIGFTPAGDGRLDLLCSGSVLFLDSSSATSRGDGDMTLIGYGDDVAIGRSGSSTAALMKEGSGSVLLDSSDDVEVNGVGLVDADASLIEMFARGGYVRILEDADVVSRGGTVDIRGANGVEIYRPIDEDTVAQDPYVEGVGVYIEAGDQGILAVVDQIAAFSGRELDMLTSGPIDLTGNFFGSRGVSIVAQDDSISCDSCDIRTESFIDSGAGPTGDILIESYGDASTIIDASNSTIKSGDNDFSSSGDVDVLIHAGGAVIQSFILPKTVKLKINTKKRDKSFIRVAGVFDSGPDEFVAAGPASVWIGDERIDGTVEPKGRRFQLRNGEFRFLITPAGAGGSRGKFNLQHKGLTIANGVDPNGDLSIRFQNDTADGTGVVTLEKGKYKLGKKAGTLTVPNLVPFKIKATHKGAGKDTLFVQAGLSTGGNQPTQAPDVTITYQGTEITVPGSEFKQNGDNFIANKPPSAPNVKKMQLNFKKEKVELNVGGLDLGPIPTQATKVTLGVTVGTDSGTVEVRVAPRKTQMRY